MKRSRIFFIEKLEIVTIIFSFSFFFNTSQILISKMRRLLRKKKKREIETTQDQLIG